MRDKGTLIQLKRCIFKVCPEAPRCQICGSMEQPLFARSRFAMIPDLTTTRCDYCYADESQRQWCSDGSYIQSAYKPMIYDWNNMRWVLEPMQRWRLRISKSYVHRHTLKLKARWAPDDE